LRQRPGVPEYIRQPQDRTLRLRAEMFAEKGTAKQELSYQGFRAAQVAVCLNPHAPDRLPASLRDTLLDCLEQTRLILPDKLIELRLALGEAVLRELLHQPDHGMKRPLCLAACLSKGP